MSASYKVALADRLLELPEEAAVPALDEGEAAALFPPRAGPGPLGAPQPVVVLLVNDASWCAGQGGPCGVQGGGRGYVVGCVAAGVRRLPMGRAAWVGQRAVAPHVAWDERRAARRLPMGGNSCERQEEARAVDVTQ